MRAVRERLIECGLPNKKIEHDVVGNVAVEFDLSRQTVLTFDYAISEIDGVNPVLTSNIGRKAIAGVAGE
jgi:hypothetical protein